MSWSLYVDALGHLDFQSSAVLDSDGNVRGISSGFSLQEAERAQLASIHLNPRKATSFSLAGINYIVTFADPRYNFANNAVIAHTLNSIVVGVYESNLHDWTASRYIEVVREMLNDEDKDTEQQVIQKRRGTENEQLILDYQVQQQQKVFYVAEEKALTNEVEVDDVEAPVRFGVEGSEGEADEVVVAGVESPVQFSVGSSEAEADEIVVDSVEAPVQFGVGSSEAEADEIVVDSVETPVNIGVDDSEDDQIQLDVPMEIAIPDNPTEDDLKSLFRGDPVEGELEKETLQEVLHGMGIMDANVAEFLWDQYDADGSGSIDFQEFSQMIFELRDIKKNFEDADVNGDKSISPTEMVPVLNKLGINMESQHIFAILKLFDSDGNDEIDFSEFLPLSIFLTTCERQYKGYVEKRTVITKWLRPLLGGDIAKEEQVAEQMEELLVQHTEPTMDAFVAIICT